MVFFPYKLSNDSSVSMPAKYLYQGQGSRQGHGIGVGEKRRKLVTKDKQGIHLVKDR